MTDTASTSGLPADSTPELSGQVRMLRKTRNWTLEELAARSGVSRSMLSQIERGEANPTVAVAFRIARAFAITLDDLVSMPQPGGLIQVIRADDPAYHFRSDPGFRVRTLSPLDIEKDIEFYEITLAPGQSMNSAPHVPGARELLAVERGEVTVTSGADTTVLNPGDSGHYNADLAHSISNSGSEIAILFLVVLYRT